MFKYSILIFTVLIILLLLSGCNNPIPGFSGPPTQEQAEEAHWRGWLLNLPKEPVLLIEKLNSYNWQYDHEFAIKSKFDFLTNNPDGKINKEIFALLFSDAVREQFFVLENGNLLYKNTEIELLETGRVVIVE